MAVYNNIYIYNIMAVIMTFGLVPIAKEQTLIFSAALLHVRFHLRNI